MSNEMYFRLKELHWLVQCPSFLLARFRNSSALWKQESQAECFEARLLMNSISLRLPWDIQVITTPAKKGKVVKMVVTAAQKRAKQKPRRKKIAREMKFF